MKYAVTAIYTMVVAVFLWLFQSDNHITTEGKDRLKYALDIATHDAAQYVDPVQRDLGYIRFDRDQASIIFRQRLQDNLKLDHNLRPTVNNLFRSTDQLQILVLDFVETGCPNKPAGFPCVYQNPTYGYIDTLYGPSVVAIISIRSPRPYQISSDFHYIVGSSHEYKPY